MRFRWTSTEGGLGSNGGVRLKVSSSELWGHAVANITPSAMPAVTISLVAVHSGAFTWLAYALIGVLMTLVAVQVGILARHFPSPGSLFFYLSKALHPISGMIAGFTMMAGYFGALAAAPLLGGLFVEQALQFFAPLSGMGWIAGIAVLYLLVAWRLALRGIEISARWGLWVEIFSILCIMLIAAVTLWHFGWLDPAQWDFQRLHTAPLAQALILSLLAYGGFETAGNLAGETSAARTAIPRVMVLSVLMVGGFFVAMAYIEVLAFAHIPASLGNNTAPLNAIAKASGHPWLGIFSDLAMATAAFSATIATLNSISRILYSMAGHGVIPRFFHHRDPRYGTPARALRVLAIIVLLSVAVVALWRIPILSVVGTFGTFTGLAFLLIYGLANIATPWFLFRQRHARRWLSLIIAGISLPLLIKVMAVSLWPLPAGGEGAATLLFVALVMVIFFWGLYWAVFQPERLRHILVAVDEP
ncbi:amino acid permease-associated region [Acidithiobacillus ferrivorans SS3]|uniref:Amino acid permease-associated region n=1 Tax=Acidithiobacillus ferrivorans SS3 TaxID=743299 RepID=G0JKQ7_9PROT|nr:APC family permease [Acidithiobacillus ferrivorans]AEM46803.1 amino acid permease-associated region [Acidithiobacillus ferrivorans SS3]MBU2767498.1 APC family permease [Acidithiobacillus ferrivorans]